MKNGERMMTRQKRDTTGKCSDKVFNLTSNQRNINLTDRFLFSD